MEEEWFLVPWDRGVGPTRVGNRGGGSHTHTSDLGSGLVRQWWSRWQWCWTAIVVSHQSELFIGLPLQEPLHVLAAAGLNAKMLHDVGFDMSVLTPKSRIIGKNASMQLNGGVAPSRTAMTGPGNQLTLADAKKLTRSARLVYIGNLPEQGMTHIIIQQFFNEATHAQNRGHQFCIDVS